MVCGLCILAFTREWVLTRASHLRELAEKAERINDWKAATKAAQEEAAEYRRQVFVLLGVGGAKD
ncbi:MAG TPA: hypothetical protein VF163_11265 [Micromonosporaceae bacterium]